MARRIMHKFRMTEISAVDRPAQAHAKSVIMKRADDEPVEDEIGKSFYDWFADNSEFAADDMDAVGHFQKRFFSAEARRKDAKSGVAMKDGSFPIANAEDLANARRLVGHAKDPAAARAHIESRARALGLGKSESQGDTNMSEELKKELDADLEKKGGAKRDSKRDNEKGDTLSEKPDDENEGKNPEKQEAMPPRVRKALEDAEDLKKRNEDMAKRLAVLEDEREAFAFAKRAESLGAPAEHGEVLRKAYKGDADAIKKHEEFIKSLTAQVDTGKLFAEFGTNRGGDAVAKAADQLQKLAEERHQNLFKAGDKKSTIHKAWTDVYLDPANADLKKRYDAEEFAKRRA